MNVRTLPTAWGITIVRVMAGIIIFYASIEKFNAGGFPAFTKTVTGLGFPVPEFWGVFIPLLELIGGAMLILGLGARWAAILLIFEYFTTSMIIKTRAAPPFGGFDSMRIDLMLLVTVVAIALVGPGAFALERVILRRAQPQLGVADFSPSP